MKDLAPHIIRQRLLVEGIYTRNVKKEDVNSFLLKLAAYLNLKAYRKPAIFSPGGIGKEINQGYDAFLPLVDSGISIYVWTNEKFVSLIVYTCKNFDGTKAVQFTSDYFKIEKDIQSLSF